MADGGGAAGAGEAGPAVDTPREYRSGPMYKLTVGLIGTYKHINEVRNELIYLSPLPSSLLFSSRLCKQMSTNHAILHLFVWSIVLLGPPLPSLRPSALASSFSITIVLTSTSTLNGTITFSFTLLLLAQVYYTAKRARKKHTSSYNDGYDDENHDYIIRANEVWFDRYVVVLDVTHS